MLLSPEAISHLSGIITGSLGISPVRNEKEIITLLKKYVGCESFDEFYISQDQPANEIDKTNYYVEQKLKRIRGTSKLTDLVEHIFNSKSLFNDYSLDENIIALNTCMLSKDRHGFTKDNFELTKVGKKYRVCSLYDSMVDYRCLFTESEIGNYRLIKEHSEKCLKKIEQKDYSGAITNARSLLEQILVEIEHNFDKLTKGYDGDLPKLMKKVLKLLGLTAENMPEELKTIYSQIFGGLNNAINGFSGMRNCMSDAHCTTYPPNRKEALLAVNTSKTLANFIAEHYFEKYVIGKG